MTTGKLALALLLVHFASPAIGALQSDPLTDFVPSQSLLLDPVPVNGYFAFDDIRIDESVLVSIDRSVWGDTVVTFSASGDVTIHGALDAGSGPLALETAGDLFLDGKVYGDSLPVSAASFAWKNNRNGNPDAQYRGGISITIIPDDPLDAVLATGAIERVDAATLSSGVTIHAFDPTDGLWIEAVQIDQAPSIVVFDDQPISAVPLPPAAALFAGAVLMLAGRVRRTARNP